MDVDLPEVHAQALDATHRLVAGIGDEQWDDVSDCEDWTVRELVNHIVTGNYWAEELASGKTIEEVGDRLDGDVLGDDPVGVYDDSAARAAAAFRAPGAMDAPCAVSYGPVPGSVYCGHRFIDVLVHGWDVAKSTGQDTTLRPTSSTRAGRWSSPSSTCSSAAVRSGPTVEVPDDADAETKLLAVLGRRA